jgi:hypothetical protein
MPFHPETPNNIRACWGNDVLRLLRARLVNRAHDSTDNRKFDDPANDPHPQNLRGQWLNGKPDEIATRA